MGYKGYNVNGNTTSTGSVTTSETTLGTFTLDSQQLNGPNDAIHVIAWGTVANNANTKTLTFYFGTTTQAFVLPANAATQWKVDVWITGLTQTSQTGIALCTAGVIANATSDLFLLTMTENTKNTIVVKTTGTGTTTNDIVQKGMLVLV